MRQHSTDLFALLVGLAFAIAGAGVIISQSTDSGLSGRATAATGLILLGAVALAVTLARSLRDPSHAYADAQPHADRPYAAERTSAQTPESPAETSIGDETAPNGGAGVRPEDPTG